MGTTFRDEDSNGAYIVGCVQAGYRVEWWIRYDREIGWLVSEYVNVAPRHFWSGREGWEQLWAR